MVPSSAGIGPSRKLFKTSMLAVDEVELAFMHREIRFRTYTVVYNCPTALVSSRKFCLCAAANVLFAKKLRATLFALQNRHFHLPKNNIRPNSEGIVPSNTLSETSNSTKLRALDASVEMEATNTTHSPKLLAKAAEPTCVPKRLAKAAEPSSVGNVPPSVFFRRRMVASTANA